MGTTGKGNKTSGRKKRAGVGKRAGSESTNKGPGMAQIVRGETSTNPAAEIAARHSDVPTDQLPPDAAAIRKRIEQA
jgi:hypothetical protein